MPQVKEFDRDQYIKELGLTKDEADIFEILYEKDAKLIARCFSDWWHNHYDAELNEASYWASIELYVFKQAHHLEGKLPPSKAKILFESEQRAWKRERG